MIQPMKSRLAQRVVRLAVLGAAAMLSTLSTAQAAGGDPQVKTDHPWYPGELSCSTFERLFKTQAELYKRVTGRDVSTDEDKALASWFWRNVNYAHGEDGKNDCFGTGLAKGDTNRDYWTGLFAHGFALCGTTHSQYTAEMHYLLGAGRSRVTGVTGHNSFEVYLKGGEYGDGKWALLDHDVSTVIFDAEGKRMLSIAEIAADLKTYKSPSFKPERQRGWRVAGLHDDDTAAYSKFGSAEYLSGFAGPPPIVNLRSGESLRRYLQPGLEDGKTFVFWGRNYMAAGIPGPERSRAWVNQPENMWKSTKGTGFKPGQVRFANAVYTYTPDFATDAYKQGVIEETSEHVTFEFLTPYVIGATPPNTAAWGIYDAGGKNGLVLKGTANCAVQVSIDRGKTWQDAGTMSDGLDLTDLVKGYNQYWLRFKAPSTALKGTNLSWTTVCQTNVATIPRLKDGENTITYLASGRGLVSAGPNKAQAEAHVVAGAMGSKTVTLELKTPRGEKAVRVYASAWQASGNPPNSEIKYQIEYSVDGGSTWQHVVKDWQIVRNEPEPKDFWSQSFTFGNVEIPGGTTKPVQVRFSNSGGKTYRTVQAHLEYEVAKPTPVEVTFAWTEGGAEVKKASRVFDKTGAEDASWKIPTGQKVETKWVEYVAK